jgi:xylan 1,4-beta-xylosidase
MSLFKKKNPFKLVNPIKRKQENRKRKAIIGGGIVALITVAALVAVTQIDKVREFFSKASGEKANIYVDTQAVLGTMPRPWRNLAQGGEAFDWRIQPLTGQVAALKPDYIRIDHVYDFYDIVGGSPGNLTFDFSKFDVILNDITATGAKPFIALSYMPPAISSGDIVSPPVNWTDWQIVVQRTIEHVSGTRGIDNVYYEVWNEPDLFGDWKYYGERNYLDLYTYAARGAQNAKGVKRFKIGGPGITALYKNWFDALAKHTLANNLRYDFFSWHRYNHKVDQYRTDMLEVRTWMQSFPQLEGKLELQITEWGHDSENHAGYDNAYGAAHTIAGAIEMVGVVDRAFVFEIQDGKDPKGQSYWGRWGMFTHADAGAKAKPRYYALKMLDKIGDSRLQLLGKGSWVKALAAKDDSDNINVVLSNFDIYGSHAETVPITFTNIEPGEYTITKEYLNGQQNSEKIATTAAELRVNVPMSPNTVSFVKLTPNFVKEEPNIRPIGLPPVEFKRTNAVNTQTNPEQKTEIQRRTSF